MRAPFWLVGFLLTIVTGTGSCLSNDSASRSPSADPSTSPPALAAQTTIPGPLRSFLRMAGISRKATPEEVLPLLTHEVRLRGYDHGRPTEYLVLLKRYLQQARELVILSGSDAVIRVANCDNAKPLLAVLGYRLREGCGSATSLQTSDPDRAFLTIDSGFPLAELEETLQGGKPFAFPFPSSQVPVLFGEDAWTVSLNNRQGGNIVDEFLRNPAVARLYGALSAMDTETSASLRQSPGLRKLVRFAPVLDFYGGRIHIRGSRVMVPGGESAEAAWKDLVGASPESSGEFVTQLVARDEGWMAAYFDALSGVSRAQQTYFTDPQRLKRFYEALKGRSLFPSPTRPIFRPAPGLPLLVNRLYVESNGQPQVPGDIEAWKEIFRRYDDSKTGRDWAHRARRWKDPEQLVEGLFALSREPLNTEPLQIYLLLSEMDRRRSADDRLSPATVRLLAEKFSRFGDQYSVFSEFNELNNASITAYVNAANALDRIPALDLRANAIGTFQATLGLWQILARQKEISDRDLNGSWQHVIGPFGKIGSYAQLFDAGQGSLRQLFQAVSGKPDLSQDEVVALLAGPAQTTPEGQQVRDELARRIHSVLDAQRLVSLDTLFALGSGLTQMSQGKVKADALLPMTAELREFEMPRPIFTRSEKFRFEHEPADTRHTTLQTRTNLARLIKNGSAQELAEGRGHLAPFLRDTLVGLNYAYYAPPGAQMIFNNAIFVRSHDYAEDFASGSAGAQPWKTPTLVNLGVTASGGTHLAGSLADLPYTLALVEQDFIVPDSVQSLIWQDLVPSLLTSAVLPRWWGVTPNELHAVTLYQRNGEELLAAAAHDEKLRESVMNILSDRVSSQRAERIEQALRSGGTQDFLSQVTPAETFYLASEFRKRFPGEAQGAAGKELDSLLQLYPAEASGERLAQDFGVPHPALAHSYARELLNVKLFPTFESYSSRLLAESWESNNLYWARLADEMGYQPVALNRLVPQLTRRMVEKLSATTLEDWPAILRAMHETGDEFRHGKSAALLQQEVIVRQNPESGSTREQEHK